MKKLRFILIKFLVLSILLSILLMGCKDREAFEQIEPESPMVSTLPNLLGAVIAPEDSPYGQFNSVVREALQRIGHRQGMQVTIIEPSDFLEKEDTIHYFGQNGASYVFIIDPAYEEVVKAYEEAYVESSFVKFYEILPPPLIEIEIEEEPSSHLAETVDEDSFSDREEPAIDIEEQIERIISS
ncbi:hypothetical protein [Heliorestis convoluta]|uniref:Putative membrane protein n=1 Tax=Heliorestis convoluta TaxID=356322 RepID=A0A5Q2N6R3_9FIRM|nr:hypothetical protein [Heliorestis convoluta]QGG48245.1 putative membrane protein [Heliorestis convoluta]